MAQDVSAEIRSRLPEELSEKLAEVDQRHGQPVPIFVESAPTVDASGRCHLDDSSVPPRLSIYLTAPAVNNLSVIGEEIMHAHRRTRRFPLIVPETPSRIFGYDRPLQALAGFFDEHNFYPFLEVVGLDPRAALTPKLGVAAEALERRRAEIVADGSTAALRIELAAAYVQAALMAGPSNERDRLLGLFDDPALLDHLVVGRALCAEIDVSRLRSPDEVGAAMTRCVYQHLGLTTQAAVIRSWF